MELRARECWNVSLILVIPGSEKREGRVSKCGDELQYGNEHIFFYQAPEKMRMKKRVGEDLCLIWTTIRTGLLLLPTQRRMGRRRGVCVCVCVCLNARRQNVGKGAGVLIYKQTSECGGWWDRE